MNQPAPSNAPETSFARLAIEYWRLLRAYDRLCARIEPETATRFLAQSRYAAARLDALVSEAGLRLVTFDGQPFHPGLPVRPLNADDFENDDALIVGSTTEPTIVADGKVVMLGAVMLDRPGPQGEES